MSKSLLALQCAMQDARNVLDPAKKQRAVVSLLKQILRNSWEHPLEALHGAVIASRQAPVGSALKEKAIAMVLEIVDDPRVDFVAARKATSAAVLYARLGSKIEQMAQLKYAQLTRNAMVPFPAQSVFGFRHVVRKSVDKAVHFVDIYSHLAQTAIEQRIENFRRH